MKIEYEFSEEQEKKYNEWIDLHKKATGKLNGILSYVITPYGMGTGLLVALEKYNGEKYHLDLTDVETW